MEGEVRIMPSEELNSGTLGSQNRWADIVMALLGSQNDLEENRRAA